MSNMISRRENQPSLTCILFTQLLEVLHRSATLRVDHGWWRPSVRCLWRMLVTLNWAISWKRFQRVFKPTPAPRETNRPASLSWEHLTDTSSSTQSHWHLLRNRTVGRWTREGERGHLGPVMDTAGETDEQEAAAVGNWETGWRDEVCVLRHWFLQQPAEVAKGCGVVLEEHICLAISCPVNRRLPPLSQEGTDRIIPSCSLSWKPQCSVEYWRGTVIQLVSLWGFWPEPDLGVWKPIDSLSVEASYLTAFQRIGILRKASLIRWAIIKMSNFRNIWMSWLYMFWGH